MIGQFVMVIVASIVFVIAPMLPIIIICVIIVNMVKHSRIQNSINNYMNNNNEQKYDNSVSKERDKNTNKTQNNYLSDKETILNEKREDEILKSLDDNGNGPIKKL